MIHERLRWRFNGEVEREIQHDAALTGAHEIA